MPSMNANWPSAEIIVATIPAVVIVRVNMRPFLVHTA